MISRGVLRFRAGQLLRRLGFRSRPAPAVPAAAPPAAAAPPPPAAPPPRVTIRTPSFDLAAPPERTAVYVGDHLALTRTVYGHKMYVDSRTQMGAHFLLDGYWEEWIVRHLKDLVRPGMHAVDVGANMGFYTLLLADLVGPAGRVTAFEANPALFDILARNVELNGFKDRTTLVKKIVHQASGVYSFASFDRYGTGAICQHTDRDSEALREMSIKEGLSFMHLEGVSLDEYFGSDGPRVDLIKVDTDGAEPFVFRGMKNLLRSGRPLTILCEFSPPAYRAHSVDPSEFFEELRGAGFRISEFTPEGIKPVESIERLAAVSWAELLLVRDAR
jgi:FkbM family methyltransferase